MGEMENIKLTEEQSTIIDEYQRENGLREEPLLKESGNRFTTFPIEYPDIWQRYKQHQSSIWTTEELDFSKDKTDWKKLTDDERLFISNILAFFAASDGIIMENINVNFAEEVQISEARSFYAVQNYMESVHSETYGLMIETFIDNREKRNNLQNAIRELPAVKKKAEWAMKWMNSK